MSINGPNTVTTVRVALCGYGAAAAAHAATLSRLSGVSLHAVSGPDLARARQFAERWSVPVVIADTETAARLPEVEAVVVATPDDAHLRAVMAAIGAGKHVYCEKPLGMDSAECAQMATAAASTGAINMVGFSNRRFPWVQAAKALIDDGTLGVPRHVHVQSLGSRSLRRPAAGDWRSDPRRASAGVLGDLGSHAFDLVRFLVGEIEEVCADLAHVHVPDSSNDDAIVLIKLSKGVHGTIAVSWLSAADQTIGPGRRHIQIAGSEGSVLIENGRAWFHPLRGEPWVISTVGSALSYDDYLANALAPSVEAFIDAVRSRVPVAPDFFEGLRCQRIIEACLRSDQEHTWIAVDDGDLREDA